MSTASPREARVGTALPPLIEGQRLDQATFHGSYEAMPPGVRAELIGGVVSMPSPVGPEHGRAQVPALVWLSYYEEKTPGVEVLDNTSTALGGTSEPQPDLLLRVAAECGGRTRAERRLLRGVPEFILEIAHATRYVDLGPKLAEYERAGVLEYVVRALEPDEVIWHVLDQGRLIAVEPDEGGLYRSRHFPGLWLDPAALVARDTRRLREVVDRGTATPEHAALAAARGPATG